METPRVHDVKPIIDSVHKEREVLIARQIEGVGNRSTKELDRCSNILSLVAMAVQVNSPENKWSIIA